jgi:hypothetical protein
MLRPRRNPDGVGEVVWCLCAAWLVSADGVAQARAWTSESIRAWTRRRCRRALAEYFERFVIEQPSEPDRALHGSVTEARHAVHGVSDFNVC